MALALPGWHGKLPALGDFVSRRLDQDLVEAWDGWLAAGMLALRQQAEGDWLEAYLASPSWCFLFAPGVLPGAQAGQAWAGVLMPSVDKVGRYFPFTLLQPLATLPSSGPDMQLLWQWLGRLDDLAADAMHDDWGIDALEDALARLGGAPQPPAVVETSTSPPQAGALDPVPLPAGADGAAWIDLEAHALWRAQATGMAYWYAQGQQEPTRLLRSHGLPAAEAMAVLLGRVTPS